MSGSIASPWGGTSYLCVNPPIQRFAQQVSGGTPGLCDGSFTIDWNAYQSRTDTADDAAECRQCARFL